MQPQDLTQFRPIALCNVLYKIASKVLANRLRPVLEEIISEEQSAFVPGRLITDNVLIAYESIHYLRRKKGKTGSCAIKLDMAKAYDRVEWTYLRALMLKIGLAPQLVDRIMVCVESVSFSVRVNGQFSAFFKPSRGIRQGDPLSPYLFLLCAEGLSCLLKFRGPNYLARGVRVGIHAPWISHLLFADDSIIFSEAYEASAIRLNNILEVYRRGSGQLVNKAKSAIFFSKNCSEEMKEAMHRGLDIESEALMEKYLRLPTALGRSSSEFFEHLPTTIKKLVNGWCPKKLSSAARGVLIQAIAQAIPTFSMSCFQLSAKTCKKIVSCIARFWWGGDENQWKMHLTKWSDLAVPKAIGGMGFRDLRKFNQAMLAKQGWRLLSNPNSLCAKVLKGKYYPNGDFLNASNKKNSSHTWRAIKHGRVAPLKGLIKRVGNGSTIRIWEDPWIPSNSGFKPVFKPANANAVLVNELLSPDASTWNDSMLEANLCAADINAIKSIPCGKLEEDTWAWGPEVHDNFSVRSAYHLLCTNSSSDPIHSTSRGNANPIWKSLWRPSAPPKVKTFWWRVFNNFMPCREVLHKKHIERMPTCGACGAQSESAMHALLECEWAKIFWNEVHSLTGVKIPNLHPRSWASDLTDGSFLNEKDTCMVLCGMWAIWKARNDRRHGNISLPLMKVVHWALVIAYDLWNAGIKHGSVNKPKIRTLRHPPDDGWTKINVDGAFSSEEGASGAIARDHRGLFLAVKAIWYPNAANALSMEAHVIRDGVIETDSLVLSKVLNSGNFKGSEIVSILFDIVELSKVFCGFSVVFIRRAGNVAAHICAQYSVKEKEKVHLD
jgi:hypothetical protein